MTAIEIGGTTIPVDGYTIAAFAIALLALYFILSAILGFARVGMRSGCRWKRLRKESSRNLNKWRCARCSVEAFTTDRWPPKECKRLLEGRPL